MKNYIISQSIPTKKYYEVYINADSNDGNYISTIRQYSQRRFDEIIPALIDLKQNYSEPGQLEDYATEYDISIPYSDYGSCHTLDDIRITMYDTNGYVYNVDLILDNI